MKARLALTLQSLSRTTPPLVPMVIIQGEGAPLLELELYFFPLPNRPIEAIKPEDVSAILGKAVVLSEVRTLQATDVYSREYRREVGAWYEEFRRQLLEERALEE